MEAPADDGDDYEFVKRAVPKSRRPVAQDVWVTRRSNRAHLFSVCDKLLLKGDFCVIHGLGAAIERAVELALEVQERWDGKVTMECQTDTVSLVDELLPEKDGLPAKAQTRLNSSIAITIRRAK